MGDEYAVKYLAESFRGLMRRYGGSTPEAFQAVLSPLLIPIRSLDKAVMRLPGQNHYRASFTVAIHDTNRSVLTRGRTGKFVPATFKSGATIWREIAKGRIIDVDAASGVASGEVYVGSQRAELLRALEILSADDLLEIDQYGAAAKVLSGLAEYFLVETVTKCGYSVCRMPEDMARHLGAYLNYDFEFGRNGVLKKVEAKSIWGTDTRYARLIHSLTTRPPGDPSSWTEHQRRNYYPTSSCKFATQDIFAVSLFLRTGNIRDFAFARSVSKSVKPYGLPPAAKYPEHVNQNPPCNIGDGTWFATIDEVWDLE